MSATLAPLSARSPRDFSNFSPLLWWHLLSLDAPTIAGLWCWSFAHAFEISLPWFGLATLCLGTWCVYVADRLLDGWHKTSEITMRERHYFYSRHRRMFLVALAIATLPLTYLIFTRVSNSVRKDDVWLAFLGLIYFVAVHNSLPKRWLPKEIVVGVLFAIATAVPCWSRLHGHVLWMLLCDVVFAFVCSWNCIAIQVWEDVRTQGTHGSAFQHPLTVWAGQHLSIFAVGLILLPTCMDLFAATVSLHYLLASYSLCGIAFLVLDRLHSKMEIRTLRIAVDFAMLTPFLWMSIVH